MTHLIAAAFPVLPGKESRVINCKDELAAVWDEFEKRNAEATLKRYAVFHQPGPEGSLAIHVLEFDDPAALGRSFGDTPYDRWWLSYLKEVHGFDLPPKLEDQPPPPSLVFEWQRGV